MDLSQVRVAIASNALGKASAGHDIQTKLVAAKAQGFGGIELAFECLEAHASSVRPLNEHSRPAQLQAAASDIQKMASRLSLEIIALQPFGSYDLLEKQEDVDSRLEEASLWLQLCQTLRSPILQVCSCIYPLQKPVTSNINQIADNMRRLGLLAQEYNVTIAYEAPAWGIHIDQWQQTRDIMALVGLPNVRLCLDTYHIAAVVAADPFNCDRPLLPDGLRKLSDSLEEMAQTVRAADIGYLQLSDATVADANQTGYPRRDLNQPAFMTQSRNCRIFPCEPEYGGTLPAEDVAKAIFKLGYRGWVSMEVFHTDHWLNDPSIPYQWAGRGMSSWRKVAAQC